MKLQNPDSSSETQGNGAFHAVILTFLPEPFTGYVIDGAKIINIFA